jgi:paraquat-inducible protein B
MKAKVSPAIVGAFVIGAFALALVALLAFGGINFFHNPPRFVVFFDESTHGLELGSPVKLRGVRVGRVVAINVRYDPTKSVSAVAVVCEVERDVVTDPAGEAIDIGQRTELQGLVARGLRAQLGFQGLATGLLFVELEFFDPKDYPADERTDPKYQVVPAVRSDISTFLASVTDILTNIRKIDFAAIAKNLNTLIADARQQLSTLNLAPTIEQWRKTGAQVEALAASPEFKRTFDNLNGAVADLRATITKLDGKIDPTSKELSDTLAEARRTIATFNETAATARKFITAHADLGAQLGDTLQHLNDAAESVKELADFLERNPNALLTGRKRPD